jgi:hypothetical protein
MGIRADRHVSDGRPVLLVTTNVGDVVAVDAEHPLRVRNDPSTGEPSTYVHVRGGLEARLARPPWYEVVGWAEADPDGTTMSVSSSGISFPIGAVV